MNKTESEKICQWCGKPIIPDENQRKMWKRKYHPECAKAANKKLSVIAQKARREKERAEKQKKKSPLSISDVCKLAKEKGISYGKYVEKHL